MGVSAGYGFWFGNPNNIMIGWDAMGNGCGYTNVTKNYPMLYFPTMPNATTLTSL